MIPVAKTLVPQWLSCQAPGVKWSVIVLVGPMMGEIASVTGNFFPSVAARMIVPSDPFLRHTSRFLGR